MLTKEETRKYKRDWARKKRARIRASLSEAELQEKENRILSSRFKKGQIPWNRNKKGTQIAWNKGLTKETDERVAKNAAATSNGVKLLWSQPLYCGGNKKGVKFNLSPLQRRGYSIRTSGKWNPMYGKSGDKSPVWLGGISFEPYPPEFNNKLKKRIKTRDGYQCQLCGTREKLAIHHIDYEKQNCEDDNLVTLCLSCNVKVNKNREYWTEYFQKEVRLCHFQSSVCSSAEPKPSLNTGEPLTCKARATRNKGLHYKVEMGIDSELVAETEREGGESRSDSPTCMETYRDRQK